MRVGVEGAGWGEALALQTIITLAQADTPYHTQHSSHKQQHKEAHKGKQTCPSCCCCCCGTKWCEKAACEESKRDEREGWWFCPLSFPPTPCVAALAAPVYCIFNAQALQVDVEELYLILSMINKPQIYVTGASSLVLHFSVVLLFIICCSPAIDSNWFFLIQATNRGLNTLHQKFFFEGILIWRGLHQLEIKLLSSIRIGKENYCVRKQLSRCALSPEFTGKKSFTI